MAEDQNGSNHSVEISVGSDSDISLGPSILRDLPLSQDSCHLDLDSRFILTPPKIQSIPPPCSITSLNPLNPKMEGRYQEDRFIIPELNLYRCSDVSIDSSLNADYRECIFRIDCRNSHSQLKLFKRNSYSIIKERGYLLSSGGQHMHHHWLFDVCSKIIVWEKYLRRSVPLFLPHTTKSYQLDILLKLGIDTNSIIFFDSTQNTMFKDLLFTPCFSVAAWLWPRAMTYLRDRLLEVYEINLCPDPSKKLFINREDQVGEKRTLMNQPAIQKCAEDCGFQGYSMGGFTFREQLDLFASAGTLVIVHGSAGANVLATSEETTVVHLHPDSTGQFRAHGRFGGILGQKYHYFFGSSYQGLNARTHLHQTPWYIDPTQFLSLLNQV